MVFVSFLELEDGELEGQQTARASFHHDELELVILEGKERVDAMLGGDADVIGNDNVGLKLLADTKVHQDTRCVRRELNTGTGLLQSLSSSVMDSETGISFWLERRP